MQQHATVKTNEAARHLSSAGGWCAKDAGLNLKRLPLCKDGTLCTSVRISAKQQHIPDTSTVHELITY